MKSLGVISAVLNCISIKVRRIVSPEDLEYSILGAHLNSCSEGVWVGSGLNLYAVE